MKYGTKAEIPSKRIASDQAGDVSSRRSRTSAKHQDESHKLSDTMANATSAIRLEGRRKDIVKPHANPVTASSAMECRFDNFID